MASAVRYLWLVLVLSLASCTGWFMPGWPRHSLLVLVSLALSAVVWEKPQGKACKTREYSQKEAVKNVGELCPEFWRIWDEGRRPPQSSIVQQPRLLSEPAGHHYHA